MRSLVCLAIILLLVLCIGVVSANVTVINASYNGRPGEDTPDASAFHYLRDEAGDTTADSSSELNFGNTLVDADNFAYHYRAIVSFNTSEIPDDAEITEVILSTYPYEKASTLTTADASVIYATPASETSFVAGDYERTNFTRLASDVAYADIPSGGWMNHTFNAFGISIIDVTGYTPVMLDHSKSVDNTSITLVTPWKESRISLRSLGYSSGAYAPKLYITYTPAEEPDTTPPANITSLSNTTATAWHRINWTWVDPTDADFSKVMVYKNGVFYHNVTKGTLYDKWLGLSESTEYTISTKTVDTFENVDTDWTNRTLTTPARNLKTWPRVMLTFDDGSETVYNRSYPILSPYGFVGTAYVVGDLVGDADYMNTTQLTTLDAAGWDIGNHGWNHTDLTTVSMALQRDIIQDGQEYLDSIGLDGAMYHLAYPYGGYNADVGSSAATVGTKTGRTVAISPLIIPRSEVLQIPLNISTVDTTSVDTIKSYIADGDDNETMVYLFHEIGGSGTYTWSEANLQSLADWMYDNGYQTINITEWYDLNSGISPPASITNLNNTTTCNSINWTWTNPGDTDFNHTYILKDNVFDVNATNTTAYRLWESLSENTAYTFSSKTVDTTGNMNATWVNNTSTTKTSVTASFTKNATNGLYPFGLQVNDTSTGSTLTSWNWSWGDGTWTNTTNSASRNATKTYSTGGNYTIYLIGTNSCGSDTSDNQYVDVWNQTKSGFTANVTGGFYNLPVLFTVNTTADNATFWNWSFGDESAWQNGTTQNGTHTYTTGGLYTVIQIAGNPYDTDSTTRTNYIDIWNYTSVDFSANVTSGNAALPVGFTDSSTNATSWYWDFGDDETSTDQNPVHTYDFAGVYTVDHSASNTHHTSWENKTGYITVHNATPTADFTSEPPTEGNAPLTVQFFNNSVGDGIIGWNWTFGDGGTDNVADPSYEYTTPGTYDVNLTVWNDGGSDDEKKLGYIIVHNATPVANFTANVTTGCIPTTVQFTDNSTGNNLSWSWKLNGVEFATTKNATYEFTAPGLYEWLNLTVTNDGGSDTESWQDVFYFVDCAPDPITGLTNDTTTCDQLTFDWTNPTNTNFNHTYVMRDNVFNQNVSNSSSAVTWTGLTDGVTYLFSSQTVSILGNQSTTWVNMSATVKDCTPPASITNLANDTPTCNSINWSWTNPTDADYNGTMIYNNGVFVHNGTAGSTGSMWGSLAELTSYTFSSRTFDVFGNVNATWQNKTAITAACGDAPVSGFSVNATTVCLGESSLFTDESTNTPDEWYWMFGDTDTSTDQDPTHEYLSLGTFDVFLNATNAYGSDWENKTGYMIVVDCTAPSPITGLTGTVDSCSQITWDWTNPADTDYSHIMVYRNNVFQYNLSDPDAQDVWSSLSASTSYTFSSRSCDTTGNCNTTWANSTESTSACPNPPVADFGVDDQTICAGDTATFTDTPAGGTPSSWFWEFGDGGDSTDENPTYQYLVPGTFDVNLKETNGDGSDWENKTNYMIVSNCTPIAAFAANDTSVCNDTAVLFTDATTNTPDNWDWFFWANETKGSDVQNPVTSFSTPGTYSIRLFASNTTYGGTFENKTDYITVTDCTPDSTAPGNVTNLNGTSSSCGVATWTWDDPVDADLLYVQFWINDVYNANVTKGTQTHSEYGLATGSYNASTRTVDITGNWNTSWTNATQLNVTACAAASGGSGGGSTYTGDLSTMALVFGMMGGLIMGLMIVTRR